MATLEQRIAIMDKVSYAKRTNASRVPKTIYDDINYWLNKFEREIAALKRKVNK